MTYSILTFRGAANGWQVRTAKRDRTAAARFLHLLNRVENDLLHKVVAD